MAAETEMRKPLGSNKILTARSSYGDVVGNDINEINDGATPTYNAIDADADYDKSRRTLNYGQIKPRKSAL